MVSDAEPAGEGLTGQAVGRPGPTWSGDGALSRAARRAEPADGRMLHAGLTIAPYWLRIVGFAVDQLVFGMLIYFVMSLGAPLVGAQLGTTPAELLPQLQRVQPYVTLAGVGYHWLWNALGWSPGKRLLGMRTVEANGGAPGPGRGLLRALWAVLSESLLLLGYLWAGWDGERRTWHDRLAGTWVVRVPKGDAPPREGR